MIYVAALALPFLLNRLGVVRASKWGPFMDRQFRWVWLFAGLLVGPYLLTAPWSDEHAAREELREEGFVDIELERRGEEDLFELTAERDGRACSGIVTVATRRGARSRAS